MTNTDTI